MAYINGNKTPFAVKLLGESKSASGTGSVQCDNVSSVKHNVKVNLSSPDYIARTNILQMPYPFESETVNGVTATVAADGRVFINWDLTATADGRLYLAKELYLKAGTYKTECLVYYEVSNIPSYENWEGMFAISIAAIQGTSWLNSPFTITDENTPIQIFITLGHCGDLSYVPERINAVVNVGLYDCSDGGNDYSSVKVTRLGKNLLNAMEIAMYNNATDYVQDEANNSFTIRGDEGTLAYLYNTGQLMFPYANTNIVSQQGISVKAGVTYILSFDYLLLEQGKYSNFIRAVVSDANLNAFAQLDSEGAIGETLKHYLKFTPSKDDMICVVFRINNNYVTISNIQLEAAATASDFEPYIEPTEYTANADGTVKGVTSIAPTMILEADGVTIAAEYNEKIYYTMPASAARFKK